MHEFSITENLLAECLKTGKEKYQFYITISSEEEKNDLKDNVRLGMKVTISGIRNIPSKNGNKMLFQYRDYLRSIGIFYQIEGTSYKIHPNSPPFLYKVKEGIYDNLNKINTPYLQAFLFGNLDDLGEEEKDAMLAAFEKSLAELCAYAVEAGEQEEYVLTVSVETGDRYYDRHYLLGPTNEAVAIVRRVKEKFENVGILLDQSHFPVMREDPHKALWQARDYLSHVHIGNSYVKDMEKPYFGDKHLPFGVPDSEVGVEELARFLTTLREIGFFDRTSVTRKPLVSFEVGPFGDEPEELVIANVKRVFIEAWQKIKWKE